ncbi:MAG: MaoC/PaaZ C-terminal domain-containing protein [Chloroflexota bacterium]|jgi:acyl dehydratase|nr:MaoC/PaaZ C-terminal domain-containing protein [Dehalococcoidia bacterium]MDW8046879.1 MaoC/PaaZ C-terminal domain-containing protein [Chloroflexota bacterium]
MGARWSEVHEGMEIPPLKKNCSTQQLVMWAAASGDFYQIHYDKDFALATGLKNIIVHGALKHAFLGQLLHDWIGNEGRIKRFGCSYRGMDYPNQDIICRGIVTRKYEKDGEKLVDLEIWTENPEGQKTSPGSATVRLPE